MTAWPVGAKDGDSHALSPKSYSSWPAVGAFAPSSCAYWDLSPECHKLPSSPQQVAFSSPSKKSHLLLIPTTEAQSLPQMGGWGLPPSLRLDICVSLSLRISKQHLKPLFSWQKLSGGLLLLRLSAVSLTSPAFGSPFPFCCSFQGAEPHWVPGV